MRVLERLKVIAGDDTVKRRCRSGETYYANVYPEMQDDNLVFWDEASIDTRAFEALADFIAGRRRRTSPSRALTLKRAVLTACVGIFLSWQGEHLIPPTCRVGIQDDRLG